MPRSRYQRADAASGQTEDQVDPQVRGHGGENVSHQERVHIRGAAGGVLVLIVGAARKDVQGTEGHHGAEAEHQQPAGQACEHACAQGGAGGPVRERRDRAGGQGDQNREQVEQAACELFARMAELGRAARPDLTRPHQRGGGAEPQPGHEAGVRPAKRPQSQDEVDPEQGSRYGQQQRCRRVTQIGWIEPGRQCDQPGDRAGAGQNRPCRPARRPLIISHGVPSRVQVSVDRAADQVQAHPPGRFHIVEQGGKLVRVALSPAARVEPEQRVPGGHA